MRKLTPAPSNLWCVLPEGCKASRTKPLETRDIRQYKNEPIFPVGLGGRIFLASHTSLFTNLQTVNPFGPWHQNRLNFNLLLQKDPLHSVSAQRVPSVL